MVKIPKTGKFPLSFHDHRFNATPQVPYEAMLVIALVGRQWNLPHNIDSMPQSSRVRARASLPDKNHDHLDAACRHGW